MAEAPDSESDLSAASWEPWLRERFVAYLLHGADGQPRPIADVERMLARLSGERDSLARLCALAFLLDPDSQVRAWMRDVLPPYLRRVRVRSESVLTVQRGAVRGSLDWNRTLSLQTSTQDPSWFATRSLRRTLETPELVTIRWVVERIRVAATMLLRGVRAEQLGWTSSVSALLDAANEAESHSVLRGVPVRRPRPDERLVARGSHDPAVRQAAQLLDVHDELMDEPAGPMLRDALSRHALVPLSHDTQFQLYALLSLVDAVERVVGTLDRADAVIGPGRAEVVRWVGAGFEILLHYDQAAGPGAHADVMKHYFGRVQSLRPDLRLVATRDGITRELIVDAKRSWSSRYLADAHHKMHGYIADRRHAFEATVPKAIVVCPVDAVGEPRPQDDVVFVGAAASVPDCALDRAVRTWWSGVAALTLS